MSEPVLLYTTWPDTESAEGFAAEAVAERLAACGNVLAPMTSIYRWKGAVERAAEVPLLLKTTRARSADLVELLRRRHPYELPCAVALPFDAESSSPDFLHWVREATAETDPNADA